MTPRGFTYKLYLGCDRGPLHDRLLRLLREAGLRWEDLSPAPGASGAEVRRRMRAADAVLLAGLDAPGQRAELELARALGRPIIGVAPRGERTVPESLRRITDEVVGWKAELVVDSLRQYALPG